LLILSHIHQWKAELGRHVADNTNGLRILTVEDSSERLPSSETLMVYDIILFSKTRFEKEHDDGSDSQGRTRSNLGVDCRCPYIGATRTRDCSCLRIEDIYTSPLKELHFLRIIIDEGHEFSSSSSRAVVVATKLVTAERRWVVSGTPAKERLFGVDIELAAHATTENYFPQRATDQSQIVIPEAEMRAAALNQQSRYNRDEERQGAARPIGILLSNFLQVRPWASFEGEPKLDWEDYFFRHSHPKNRTYDAFSPCMQATLESLVIKVRCFWNHVFRLLTRPQTRPDDVEKDVVLPKLDHKVIYLQPCFYDRLTTNLFVLVLTANAVTSERTDASRPDDYLDALLTVKGRLPVPQKQC
jgi:hypothetical protein